MKMMRSKKAVLIIAFLLRRFIKVTKVEMVRLELLTSLTSIEKVNFDLLGSFVHLCRAFTIQIIGHLT